MGWQWHQLDHMQIICTSLQTDKHENTLLINFYRMLFLTPNQQRQSTEGKMLKAEQCLSNHHHHHFLRPFFRDHLGEPVPEENLWTSWCKGRLTEADTPTIPTNQCPPPPSPILSNICQIKTDIKLTVHNKFRYIVWQCEYQWNWWTEKTISTMVCYVSSDLSNCADSVAFHVIKILLKTITQKTLQSVQLIPFA